jgi:hypothetical protein
MTKTIKSGWIRAGEYIEDAYAKIPKFDRVYRWAIPLPMETSSGKQFYIPMPKSEMGMVIQGIAYNAINVLFDIFKDKNVEKTIKDLRTILGDAMGVSPLGPGSLHPIIKGVTAGLQYLGGQNPIDFYKNKNVISPYKYENDPAEDRATVGKFIWNNVGLATIWRIDDEAIDFANKDWFEIALGLPVVGNPLGRFVRVSDAGLDER